LISIHFTNFLFYDFSDFYQPQESDSFICTTGVGMTHCSDIPEYDNHYYSNKSLFEQDWINWNQFYSKCRTSNHNPFKDSISFDNIAYAWLTIFQV
jgi:hypothetical protein